MPLSHVLFPQRALAYAMEDAPSCTPGLPAGGGPNVCDVAGPNARGRVRWRGVRAAPERAAQTDWLQDDGRALDDGPAARPAPPAVGIAQLCTTLELVCFPASDAGVDIGLAVDGVFDGGGTRTSYHWLPRFRVQTQSCVGPVLVSCRAEEGAVLPDEVEVQLQYRAVADKKQSTEWATASNTRVQPYTTSSSFAPAVAMPYPMFVCAPLRIAVEDRRSNPPAEKTGLWALMTKGALPGVAGAATLAAQFTGFFGVVANGAAVPYLFAIAYNNTLASAKTLVRQLAQQTGYGGRALLMGRALLGLRSVQATRALRILQAPGVELRDDDVVARLERLCASVDSARYLVGRAAAAAGSETSAFVLEAATLYNDPFVFYLLFGDTGTGPGQRPDLYAENFNRVDATLWSATGMRAARLESRVVLKARHGARAHRFVLDALQTHAFDAYFLTEGFTGRCDRLVKAVEKIKENPSDLDMWLQTLFKFAGKEPPAEENVDVTLRRVAPVQGAGSDVPLNLSQVRARARARRARRARPRVSARAGRDYRTGTNASEAAASGGFAVNAARRLFPTGRALGRSPDGSRRRRVQATVHTDVHAVAAHVGPDVQGDTRSAVPNRSLPPSSRQIQERPVVLVPLVHAAQRGALA